MASTRAQAAPLTRADSHMGRAGASRAAGVPGGKPDGMPRLFCEELGIRKALSPSPGGSSTRSVIVCDHHFIAYKVPSEIKAGSQFMTPDAT